MNALALVTLLACSAAAGPPQPKSTAEMRDEARKDLDALGARIDALERQAKAAGVESRDRLEEQVRKLRSKKDKADELLLKLQESAEDAGKEIQADLDRDIRELKRACRSLQRKLKGSQPKGKDGSGRSQGPAWTA
jgi:chromosome segregation ATPase